MNKYIDAEKLIAEIERYKQGAAIARFDNAGENADYFQGKVDLCDDLTHIITSLQQEQTEDIVVIAKTFLDALSKTPYNNKPITDAQVIVKQLLVFLNNPKLYNPNALSQQEQPEVDLGMEIEKCLKQYNMLAVGKKDFTDIARHFYELGKARKE